jgi:CubicO group peptidase (beta-lactamase class C family)
VCVAFIKDNQKQKRVTGFGHSQYGKANSRHNYCIKSGDTRSFSVHYRAIFICLLPAILITCSRDPGEDIFVPYKWETASPASVGMSQQLLDSAFIVASGKEYIDALLVIKDGKIVGEQYYNGFTQDQPHNVMSVSKSMLSAIAGVALQEGYIDGLDSKMLDYFPDYVYEGIDPRKHDITIQHLLNMRMGIEGEASDNYSVYTELYNSDNWIQETIEYPLIYNPGERMRYNTFITHILSGVITEATGMSTHEFAFENLFKPMGIDIDFWEQGPQGIYFGGNSMQITPREMAAFGYMYLNDGMLNGKQIIPRDWVLFSRFPSTDMAHPNEWGGLKNYNYANLWWLGQFNLYDCFMAIGYGGQFIFVFPVPDLVVVSTAENNVAPEATTEQEWAIHDLLTRYILPALGSR